MWDELQSWTQSVFSNKIQALNRFNRMDVLHVTGTRTLIGSIDRLGIRWRTDSSAQTLSPCNAHIWEQHDLRRTGIDGDSTGHDLVETSTTHSAFKRAKSTTKTLPLFTSSFQTGRLVNPILRETTSPEKCTLSGRIGKISFMFR